MRHLSIALGCTVLAGGIVLAGCSCTSDLGTDGHDAGADARAIAPRTDECGNGRDDDENGRIDDGCPCAPGESQRCFSGTTSEIGACAAGSQVCEREPGREWGDWGASACDGEVLPAEEACDGAIDDDCDGAVDEGCPCTDGATQRCLDEFVIAPCRSGEQTCRGGAWSGCEGAIMPSADVCGDGIDNDCDGTADDLCACEPVPEVCRNGIDDDCDGVVDEPACTPDWPRDAGMPDASIPMPTCDELRDPTGSDWTITATPVADGSNAGATVEASRVAIDGDGNVFVLGMICDGTSSVAGFPVSSHVVVDYAVLTCSPWLVALDPTGALRYGWNPVLDDEPSPSARSSGPVAVGQGLAPDGAGGVWVAGHFVGQITLAPGRTFIEPSAGGFGADAFLVHIDATGTVRETIVVGEEGSGERFRDVIMAGGEPVVMGATSAPIIGFGSTLVRASSGFFVARVALDGEPRFVAVAKRSGSIGDLTPGRMTLAADGDVVVFGQSSGDADFAGTPLSSGSVDSYRVWTWTIDAAAGTTAAVRSWAGVARSYPTPTSARYFPGFIGIAGTLRGSIDLDGVTLTAGTGTSSDPFTPFLASFDDATTGAVTTRALATTPFDDFHVIRAQVDWNVCHEAMAVAIGARGTGATNPQYDFGDGLVTVRDDTLQLVQWGPDGALDFRREVSAAGAVATGVEHAAWSPVERLVVVAVSHGSGHVHSLSIRRLAFR